MLEQIESWPEGGEGTSWSTRQPFRRRHQALPARTGASGVAARLMQRRLARLLAGATLAVAVAAAVALALALALTRLRFAHRHV